MRSLASIAFVVSFVVGCGTSPPPNMGDDDGDTPAFEVITKDAMLAPGDQITYCYYFHTSNTTDVLVDRWVSDMSPGSHHGILFLNPSGNQPADGTLDTSGCGGLQGGTAPIWTYATQTPHQEEILPTDDGEGKPLAQKIAPNSAAFFQLHYLNATDQPLTAHMDLKAYALPAGTAFTQTDAYVTYNNDIAIPPHATGFKVSASCALPTGVKFWTVSTHSHKQSVATDVLDGSAAVFQSTDWEHPGSQSWMTTPFYTFGAPRLTWECTYDNTGDNANNTVVAGPSAVTNEMCMATGYFFPSTGPQFRVQYNGSCFSL